MLAELMFPTVWHVQISNYHKKLKRRMLSSMIYDNMRPFLSFTTFIFYHFSKKRLVIEYFLSFRINRA